MASAITGTTPLTPKTIRDFTMLSYDKLVQNAIGDARQWPRDVPVIADVTILPGPNETVIGYKWFEDFGQSHVGYTQRVLTCVTYDDVERWRLAATEARKQPVPQKQRGVLAQLFDGPNEVTAAPVAVACTGCGMDTLGDPNNIYDKSNALCYYCKELKDVRAENAKTIAKYYSRLPWRQRRQFAKDMGWKKPGTESSGPR